MIATCRNNTWTMRPTFLLLSNDQHQCFITHCLHRRRAPLVLPHCTTDHHGLEVVSTLPRWYYLDDGDNYFFWHVNHSSRVPCAIVHRPSGLHLVSPLARQCFLQSTDVVRCFFSWWWWRCLCNFTVMAVLTSSMIWIKKFLPESKSVSVYIFVCVIFSREF